MENFKALYLPIGVPTFHKESIDQQFELSVSLLEGISLDIEMPPAPLLAIQDLISFLEGKACDLAIIQNNSFANSEYTSEILRRLDVDVLLWTLKEPVVDGGRLRLNSLTGAYSAGNLMHHLGKGNFEYIWGSPKDPEVVRKVSAVVAAARLKKDLRSMTLASIGHTPQGFGFGRGIDAEINRHFGMGHMAVEVRELMQKAKKLTEEECGDALREAESKMLHLHAIPKENVRDFVRLYKAYNDFIKENNIAAISSRCWPDFFVEFGTPVCGVLGLLNDNQLAAACEADAYGALSMLIGMRLSGQSVFFGDPVSLDKEENTVTYWHCGTAACSLAHPSKGAETGVHPNRKIGPTMEFGCKPAEHATVFRVGRKPDGSIRFFISKGRILDKPQQFLGTSLVFQCERPSMDFVDRSVRDGWEPHFIVAYQDIAEELRILGRLLNAEICEY
ncbi:fucose isomerase [Anaerotalea alkaliphila]|uniref:Fucose isomerase n=1 Tax=Anaerotalea alkaliphila TaxID=2662126 RepID=A0A7X5KLM9_9FIRM|nr:fucose isomerase [Anaerotalea alkaliphila]NDL67006.1 fucose isomerase [Anaerotalea alkaliphila]